MTKICPVCGKEFVVDDNNPKTCSKECGHKRIRQAYQGVKPDGSGKCMVCGMKAKPQRAFCGLLCALAYSDGTWRRELYEPKKGLGTAGLIRKWYNEGETPEKIANTLCRDVTVIREVLAID